MRPYAACFRMQRRALHVAVTPCKYFRSRARRFDERVIGGNTTVVVQTNALAGVVVQLLRAVCRTFRRTVAAITECDVQVALPIKHDARSKVHPRRRFRLHLKQHLNIRHQR